MDILKNKTAVIGIAVAVIIILGAGAAFLYSQNQPAEQTSTTSTPTNNTEAQPENNNLIGLLQSGKTQQCNFSSGDENTTTVGVVYISGDKLRSDITITEDGKEADIFMIRT